MQSRRRRVVVDDSPLARLIGSRIRERRKRAGLSQQQLAGERYTKAYISALETGAAKPSMAALNYIAGGLGTTAAEILADPAARWTRLEVDLRLALGETEAAADGYVELLGRTTDQATRAGLLRGLAEALCRLDRPGEALRAATEASELFATLDRPVDRAQAAFWLATAEHLHGNSDEARGLLLSLLGDVRAGLEAEPDFEPRVLIALAATEARRGAQGAAVRYLEEARAASHDLDDRRRGIVLRTISNTYRVAGDHDTAIQFGFRALALLQRTEAEREVERLDIDLGLAYLASGSMERAAAMIAEARSISERLHDDPLLARLADAEAQVALASGDLAHALELADAAITQAAPADNIRALIDGNVTRARALVALDRTDEALAAFEQAAHLARVHEPAPRVREILGLWADALAAAGRHETAFAVAREALAIERADPAGSVSVPSPEPSERTTV